MPCLLTGNVYQLAFLDVKEPERMSDQLGFAQFFVPQEWLRGSASYDGHRWITREGAALYQPAEEQGLVFEFARLARDGADAAVAFVQGYGLLHHGPKAEDRPREALEDIQSEARGVARVLVIHRHLRRGFGGEEGSRDELRSLITPVIEPLLVQGGTTMAALDDDRVTAAAAWAMAILVNENLRASVVRQEIRPAADVPGLKFSHVGEFVFAADWTDLLGLIYFELATVLVKNAPLRSCEECGLFFVVEDQRMRFCTPTCGGRARSRRRKASQATAAKTDPQPEREGVDL